MTHYATLRNGPTIKDSIESVMEILLSDEDSYWVVEHWEGRRAGRMKSGKVQVVLTTHPETKTANLSVEIDGGQVFLVEEKEDGLTSIEVSEYLTRKHLSLKYLVETLESY